jgi:hypothetical protein
MGGVDRDFKEGWSKQPGAPHTNWIAVVFKVLGFLTVSAAIAIGGIAILFSIIDPFEGYPGGNPSPALVALWEQQKADECERLSALNRIVPVPATLHGQLLAGMKPEVSGYDVHFPEVDAMVRVAGDEYIVRVVYVVRDTDGRDHPRQVFLVIVGDPSGEVHPTVIVKTEFAQSPLGMNPTLFPPDVRDFSAIPGEFGCIGYWKRQASQSTSR